MKVRPATRNDLDILVRWAARRHAGSAYAHIPFSAERSALTAIKTIDHDDGLMLIGERDERPVGALGAHAYDSAFMDARVSSLWSLYVDEGHGGAIALPLLREYVSWARDKGVQLVEANNSRSMNDAAFVKILGRLGFTCSGSHMHLET